MNRLLFVGWGFGPWVLGSFPISPPFLFPRHPHRPLAVSRLHSSPSPSTSSCLLPPFLHHPRRPIVVSHLPSCDIPTKLPSSVTSLTLLRHHHHPFFSFARMGRLDVDKSTSMAGMVSNCDTSGMRNVFLEAERTIGDTFQSKVNGIIYIFSVMMGCMHRLQNDIVELLGCFAPLL